jgi:hypothetical protein
VPDAELTYPGSVHEVTKAADSNRKFGVNAAIFGQRGFTNDDGAAVLSFFDRTLVADGWTRDDPRASRDAAWGQYHAFTRQGRIFAVGLVTTEERTRLEQQDSHYATYKTVYETIVQ